MIVRESWFNPDDPVQSPEAALFSLHTLLANSVGDVTSWGQMSEWLLEVGFTQPVLVNLPEGFDSSLGMADKPSFN